MTKEAKQEVLKVLEDCNLVAGWSAASVRRKLMDAVEAMPEDEPERCAAANFEAMYYEAEEKLKWLNRECECQEEIIRDLRKKCAWLEGFKEAVLRMFPEQGCGHGLH